MRVANGPVAVEWAGGGLAASAGPKHRSVAAVGTQASGGGARRDWRFAWSAGRGPPPLRPALARASPERDSQARPPAPVPVQEVPFRTRAAVGLQATLQATFYGVTTISVLTLLAMMRASLGAFERTCAETDKAMRATETAARELETLSLQLQADIPVTLEAVESASEQVEELSEDVQSFMKVFQRNVKQPVEAFNSAADTTNRVMKRAPDDIQYISKTVNLALGQWRAGINTAIGSLDSLRRTKDLEAKRQLTEEQEEASSWIQAWRSKPELMEGNQAEDDPKREGKAKRLAQKEEAEDRVAMALAAAEDAAAAAEVASGQLQEAVVVYNSLASVDETIE